MVLEYVAVAFTILLTVATSVPLGRYMARVFKGERTLLDPVFGPVERLVLRLTGVHPTENQDWKQYARSLLISNVFMWLATFAVVTLQKWLPLNPDGIASMEPTLGFNTISSFTTNTNLQHYSGETGLSYLSQLIAISFLQFVTAATGIAACVAIIRALAGNRLKQVGHFYVDVTRASVSVLLPLALLVGTVLLWQGSPMTIEGAAKATTLEGEEQTIARGVVAPEVAIKQLGTNGGGYFGPNSTHPYENPTPISNLAETWSIMVIPMAMVWTLGYMIGRRRLAVVIFATMLAVYLPMVVYGVVQETGGSPAITAIGVDQSTGSMEGKEVRFGAGLSALWGVSTTVTSNGSVNSMHDSWTPLGGLMPLVGMWLNNILGGVGVGFINMLVFVIVAVFVAGMMIGRTPDPSPCSARSPSTWRSGDRGRTMLTEVKRGVRFTIVTMILLGGGYPVVLWGVGQVLFPSNAEGSLIRRVDGTIVGSKLIGQRFTRPEYFQPRPSALDYSAASTGGSHFGSSNPDHLKAVQERLDVITRLESVKPADVPSEMVTASGGGLDPHVPPAAAELQAERVARARQKPVDEVLALIRSHTEPPTLGFLGRARVNVLELNLALDESLGTVPPGQH